MALGDLILNISTFLGSLWDFLLRLFNYSFTFNGSEISLWSILAVFGVAAFITVFIVNIFS